MVIVDEFTGRLMPGRRWSDGLHQAVEAKEGVKIERENQTLATITFQNYFRMYEKLAGMTGTADTEAAEFEQIYKLDVVVIPTNRPMIRDDRADLVYRTEREKWDAVVEEIEDCHKRGQPVARRHGLDREERAALRHAQEAGRAARRAQRQVPRARGRDRRPGRPQGRGDHRHQHGRPRHRHPARRQPRGPGAAREADPETEPEAFAAGGRALPRDLRRREHEEVVARRRPAHHRHRAPRVAAHRQPAARPRRPPGRPRLVALLPLARGRPDADLRLRPHPGPDGQARHGGGRGDRARHGHRAPSSGRRSRSKAATSRSASTCSSTTT